jgi:two-component system cell cycle sensor histidine kinase/response regulator CckA
MRRPRASWLVLLLLLAAGAAGPQNAAPHSLRVVMDDDYPPFVFRSDDGRLQGILIDQWALWEKRTGIDVQISGMDWNEALQRMRAGEFDVIDTMFETPERARLFEFSAPYVRLSVPIFFDKEISGITDLASLRGFAVAAKAGDAAVDLLRRNGVSTVLLFNSYDSIVVAARDHKVNVFVIDQQPALYYLNRHQVSAQFRHSAPISFGEFHRAVAKGNTALLQQVEQGFAAIDPQALQSIEEKWYGTSIPGNNYLQYFAYAAILVTGLMLALLIWNRALSQRVSSRTAALRESEERFRQVVENIDEVYWMTDADRKQLLYVSPGYEKTWGRSCAQLYRNLGDWVEAIHPEDRERVMRAAQSKQALGEYNEEYRVLRPDGSVRWIRDTAFPIRDTNGKVYRIAGVAEDVTERRELEEQFRQSQKMEAMGALAAGIAHDFNNILSAISGNAELALQDIGPEHPALASLNEIFKAGRRAKNLVQQILTFTRLQQPQRHVIALGSLVEETMAFLRVTLPATVELSVDLAADVPNVLVNANQIQQVLLNICTNAWHALEGKPGRITVRLERIEVDAELARKRTGLQAGPYARLSVSDTGTGMDENTLKRIFEPFFTTKPGHGSGLGLPVVHGIMSSHHGAIVASSQAGEGTTIQLYFPAAAGPVEAAAPSVEAALPQGHGQRILYIDDEEPLVLLTTRAFERQGYAVSGFTEVDRALAAFRADPYQFDLAVTDFNMPGTSGLEVAAQLMAIRPDISVVLTSGYVNDELIEKARMAGIRHVLYKPSTVREFCDAVQRVLHESEAEAGRQTSKAQGT